jgi:acyl carrier protein
VDHQLKTEIAEIVAGIAELPVERVTDDAALEQLGIDSLDGLRIVAAVERRYGIVVDEGDIGGLRTMADIFLLVRRYSARPQEKLTA